MLCVRGSPETTGSSCVASEGGGGLSAPSNCRIVLSCTGDIALRFFLALVVMGEMLALSLVFGGGATAAGDPAAALVANAGVEAAVAAPSGPAVATYAAAGAGRVVGSKGRGLVASDFFFLSALLVLSGRDLVRLVDLPAAAAPAAAAGGRLEKKMNSPPCFCSRTSLTR